jgi:hypothetical protein
LPDDRTALKDNILPLLAASPSRVITVQLASTLKTLISNDFPEKWPGLLVGVKTLLASNNIREVGAGTVVVLEMVRAFRCVPSSARVPPVTLLTLSPRARFRQKGDILTGIIEETFGILVTLAANLLNSPPAGAEQEIPAILHLILKSYKHSIVLNLSRYQQSGPSLVPWGRLLFQVVNLRIPDGAVPPDEEERERSEWWKAKKWACGILGRLFHRYCIAFPISCRVSRMRMESDSMPFQIRQPIPAAQSVTRSLRWFCTTLCDTVCARDFQGVHSTDRLICLGTSVALKEVPISDSPVLHRVVRVISFQSS